MGKHTSYGRSKDENAWRSTEAEAIHRLRDAGVRVPEPFHFFDAALIMELVTDGEGRPAPRLGEVAMTVSEAHRLRATPPRDRTDALRRTQTRHRSSS